MTQEKQLCGSSIAHHQCKYAGPISDTPITVECAAPSHLYFAAALAMETVTHEKEVHPLWSSCQLCAKICFRFRIHS